MQKNIETKKQSSFKLTIILLASFVVLCLLGSTLAWFTHRGDLTGGGTTPIAETYLYVNNGRINTPIVVQSVENTGDISKNVQFDCGNSNIDLLAVASVQVNFSDGTLLPDNNWVTLNISSSAWTLGEDGNYYYNTKISKNNVSNKITIFDTISVNNEYAKGKTLNIVVYVTVIQANQTGLNKLQSTAGYVLPDSFKNLV